MRRRSSGRRIAGLLIVWIGVSGAFYFNAVATLAVVVAVLDDDARRRRRYAARTAAARDAAGHRASSCGIRFFAGSCFGQFVTAILVRPYSQLIAAFTVNVLHAGRARPGLGRFGHRSRRFRRSAGHRVLRRAGAALAALAAVRVADVGRLVVPGFVPSLQMALGVLFAIGVGTMAMMGATNTLIQMLSPDEVRGRALSVYTMIAIGVVPARLAGRRRDRVRWPGCAKRSRLRGRLRAAASGDLALRAGRADRIKKRAA